MSKTKQKNKLNGNEIFINATGPVSIRMTNDYLFKVLLQKNEKVLRGLMCSLLHMKPEEIKEIDIRNPIIPGDIISEKDIILDVNVVFNNAAVLDIELQVVNEKNWPSRSLYYVCRNYTQLAKGEDYNASLPSIHIGLLDFTLFQKHPAFYSSFKLLETKKHYEYTDKLQIKVLDLTRIDLATKEDKAYNIDKWAQLFKAQTWEEIKMLAASNQAITEAATTIYQISEDERIRQQCEAREDYLRRQIGIQRMREKLETELAESKAALAESQIALAESRREISEKQTAFEESQKTIAEKDAIIAELEAKLKAARG